MNNGTLNIYAIGVGGFGIGSLSGVLSRAAQISGLTAVGSETHGLAQRGGVVVSTLRLGSDSQGSPLMIKGAVDILMALEPLEALRSMGFLKPGGIVIYNTSMIQPLSVRLGNEKYPSLGSIAQELGRVTDNVIPVEASAIAKELGFSQTANMVMIGVLARRGALPFDMQTIEQAVKEITPERFHEVNLKALEAG